MGVCLPSKQADMCEVETLWDQTIQTRVHNMVVEIMDGTCGFGNHTWSAQLPEVRKLSNLVDPDVLECIRQMFECDLEVEDEKIYAATVLSSLPELEDICELFYAHFAVREWFNTYLAHSLTEPDDGTVNGWHDFKDSLDWVVFNFSL